MYVYMYVCMYIYTHTHRQKYTKELLKKFKIEDDKPIKTPMPDSCPLTKDRLDKLVDQTIYQGMIVSL